MCLIQSRGRNPSRLEQQELLCPVFNLMCASVWQVDLCLRCRDTRGVPASASCPGASDRRRSAVAISQAVDERFVAPVSCCGSKNMPCVLRVWLSRSLESPSSLLLPCVSSLGGPHAPHGCWKFAAPSRLALVSPE